MIKLLDTTDNGQLAVIVNPDTGRVYGFLPRNEVLTPQDTTVYVDATPQEFSAMLKEGMFYKDGAFYKGWAPPKDVYSTSPAHITLTGPEDVSHTVDVYINDNPPFQAQTEGRTLNLTLALEPGMYVVRVVSPRWGRATFRVQIVEELSVKRSPLEPEGFKDTVEKLRSAPLSADRILQQAQAHMQANVENVAGKFNLEEVKRYIKSVFGKATGALDTIRRWMGL